MSQTKKQIAEQETISAWSREVVFAWSQWIKGTDHLDIAEWLRAYADSIDPNFANSIETISPRIAQKIREAANDIERLRKLFGDSERLSGRLQETVDQLRERLGGMRIELDEAIRERDEARREVCELENLDWIGSVCRKGTKETAVERGWDCFKETP